jgi:hypothetical protein
VETVVHNTRILAVVFDYCGIVDAVVDNTRIVVVVQDNGVDDENIVVAIQGEVHIQIQRTDSHGRKEETQTTPRGKSQQIRNGRTVHDGQSMIPTQCPARLDCILVVLVVPLHHHRSWRPFHRRRLLRSEEAVVSASVLEDRKTRCRDQTAAVAGSRCCLGGLDTCFRA